MRSKKVLVVGASNAVNLDDAISDALEVDYEERPKKTKRKDHLLDSHSYSKKSRKSDRRRKREDRWS